MKTYFARLWAAVCGRPYGIECGGDCNDNPCPLCSRIFDTPTIPYRRDIEFDDDDTWPHA